jgi:SAM-dependent methyltransferase
MRERSRSPHSKQGNFFMASTVTYGPSDPVWKSYSLELQRIVEERGLTRVCDVGGGANPVLADAFISNRKLQYTVLDISQEELDKAPAQYRKRCQDITAEVPEVGAYDLVFTQMLAEHVKDGRALHQNVYAMLAPGGMAVHFFPTMYAPPFVVNRLVPERLAGWLLDLISPRDKYQNAKFPAYYDWCRGPTKRMLQRLESIGYEVVEYRGLYGHGGYYRRLPLLLAAHKAFCRLLTRLQVPQLTSFAFVVLRKPV